MNITGTIHEIKETQQVSATFRKREFVIKYIESNPEYPQLILFQMVQDRVELIDGYKVGDEISVEFNLRGRSWQKTPQDEVRYFNSLEAWKLSPLGNVPPTAQAIAQAAQAPVATAPVDDLPF